MFASFSPHFDEECLKKERLLDHPKYSTVRRPSQKTNRQLSGRGPECDLEVFLFNFNKL